MLPAQRYHVFSQFGGPAFATEYLLLKIGQATDRRRSTVLARGQVPGQAAQVFLPLGQFLVQDGFLGSQFGKAIADERLGVLEIVLPLGGMAGQRAQLCEHGVLHPVRRQRLGWAAVRAQFLPRGADVIAILLAASDAVGRGHGVTARLAKEQALEQGIRRVMRVRLAPAVVAQQVLHLVPDIVSDDGLVFADVNLMFVANLAQISDIGEELVQRALGERPTATLIPLLGLPALGSPAQSIRFL